MFSRIEYDADPQDFVDVCDHLCTALRCSLVRAVELTSYQLTGVIYEWYKSLLRSRLTSSPTLDWFEFYNAFVERFMPKSLHDVKAREFELLKQIKGISVLDYDTRFNQLARYAPHIVVTNNMKARWFANGLREYLFRAVPLTRTSTYSDVLDMILRFEARAKERQVEREPRKKAKIRRQVFRQSEADGSGTAAGTDIVARG